MMEQSQKLLSEALALPEEERAQIASELIASLDGPSDSLVDQLWADEIRKRIEEYKNNPTPGNTWDEVRARIEKKLWGKKGQA